MPTAAGYLMHWMCRACGGHGDAPLDAIVYDVLDRCPKCGSGYSVFLSGMMYAVGASEIAGFEEADGAA